jgi:neutral ceramidase
MSKAIRLLFCFAAASFFVASPAHAEWKAGAAKANITPEGPMWMAGYASRDHVAEGKLTDLWAKSLVLEDDRGGRAALVTLDLVGIDRKLSNSICEKIAAKHSLDRQRIALCCSHTHTGPVVAGNLRPMHTYLLPQEEQQRIRDYAAALEEKIVGAVGKAIENLEPCQLSAKIGKAEFAVNRRNNPEPEVPQLREAMALKGPVDHDVPVLAVHSTSGELKAIVFGYACHATVLSSYEWSGDYPGFAQIDLEAAHPGAVALFWAGCGADQNPLPRRTVELAKEYGGQLAKAVEAVLASEMTPVGDGLAAAYREVELPLASTPTKEQLESEAASADKYVAARAKMLLDDLENGKPIPASYPYPVESWRLGDEVKWVFLGGEVVVDYSLRLKAELGESIWTAGYANDVMAYIPSRRVLTEGGYEGAGAMVYYGLPSPWHETVEELIVEAVKAQVK